MIAVRIRGRHGLVETRPSEIQAGFCDAGSVQLQPSTDGKNLTISAFSITFDEWYTLFIATLRKTIEAQLQEYIFDSSNHHYLTSINNCKPTDSGRFTVVGNEHVTLYPSPDADKLLLSVVRIPDQLRPLLYEINIFTWRLYHAYNYLIRRIFSINPLLVDKNHINVYGRCFGTYQEYQAQVARWNHYVWRSAYVLQADTVNEKVAIFSGYTAQECAISKVTVTTTIALNSDSYNKLVTDHPADKGAIDDAIAALTIFRNGVSSNLGKVPGSSADDARVNVTMLKTYKDNSTRVLYGTGYEAPIKVSGDSGTEDAYADLPPNVWTLITITQTITDMVKGEYHGEVFALAVALGTVKTLMVPEAVNGYRLPFDIKSTWRVDYSDNQYDTFIKTQTVQPLAVNVEAEDVEE